MDRKFANRIIKDISSELNLKKVKRLAYRLIGENGFYAIVGFTFEGSNWQKGCFYIRFFVHLLYYPHCLPEEDMRETLAMNHGYRVGKSWTEDEFMDEREKIYSKFHDFLDENKSLAEIYRGLQDRFSSYEGYPNLFFLEEAMYTAIILKKYSDAEYYAHIGLESIKNSPADWKRGILTKYYLSKVLEFIESQKYEELTDWLKNIQSKIMIDLKIPYLEE